MENIYQWDRDDKLFAVQGLKASSSPERGAYLLQLVIDDDPVVRGKAALALQDCGDDVLLEAADALLDQNEVETTILACEILGFTEDEDFSNRVEPLLESSDDRVVRSVIEILDELPGERTLQLLETVVSNYEKTWSKAIFRLLNRLRASELSPILEKFLDKVDVENRVSVLRVAARIAGENDREWFDQLRSGVSINEEKEAFLEWLLQS